MYKLILSTVVLALAVPATAQVGGSINSNAPKCTTSVEFNNSTKLKVTYTAIHFGKGKWQGILDAKDRQERFNKFAESKPIGSVHISAPVTASNKEIPAGKYSMFFTVHEQFGWIMNLKPEGDGEAIRWGMKMKDTDSKNTRFRVSLDPGADANTCSIAIAFGKKVVSVPLKVGQAKKTKKSGVR